VASIHELKLITDDLKSYPINYNHYYTDTIKKRRQFRESKYLAESIEAATKHQRLHGCHSTHTSTSIDVGQAVDRYSQCSDPDMEKYSCEGATTVLCPGGKARFY